MPQPLSLSGRPVLVTGGCGFIGAHLVRRLLELGAGPVRVLDALLVGDARLRHAGDRVALHRFRLGDDDPAALPGLLRGVDTLFHLAALKHSGAQTDGAAVLRSNVDGSWALFEAAAAAGVRRVVFASSLYAYGRRHAPPMEEGEVPLPDTVYGISKLTGERLLAQLRGERGLDSCALRYFFTYGPGQYPGSGYRSVVVRNIERLRSGQPASVFGDGEQALDYVYVEDVVEATLLAATHPAASGALFNVGSGRPTRVADLIERLLEVSGVGSEPERLPADATHGTWRVASTERIREQLGWRPRVELDEGLARTWAASAGDGA